MVNWQQTLKYLQEHGKDSLPRDMIHYILWKPRAWIKNFIYNTCVALPVGMVYIIGIVCFAPLLVLPFHQRSIPRRILFFTLIAYMYTVFLNTALILFVEWRWYIVPSLLLIACGVASLRYALRSRFIYMLELKLVSSGTVIKKACKFFGYGLPRLFLTLQLIYLLFTFYRLFK